jgi:hypothetical protein
LPKHQQRGRETLRSADYRAIAVRFEFEFRTFRKATQTNPCTGDSDAGLRSLGV